MSKYHQRLVSIKESLEDIEFILKDIDFKITKAIQNKILKPAIRMHIIKIAEQFSKIKDNSLLSIFDSDDVKGAIDTRNFIAHDYEGINFPIIEFIIRERLPILNNDIKQLLD